MSVGDAPAPGTGGVVLPVLGVEEFVFLAALYRAGRRFHRNTSRLQLDQNTVVRTLDLVFEELERHHAEEIKELAGDRRDAVVAGRRD